MGIAGDNPFDPSYLSMTIEKQPTKKSETPVREGNEDDREFSDMIVNN